MKLSLLKVVMCFGTGLFLLLATDIEITVSYPQGSGQYVSGGIIIDVKEGECPKSDPTLSCRDDTGNCTADCVCPKNEKCCFQENCGNICMEPDGIEPYNLVCRKDTEISRSKPGTCPKSLMEWQCKWCATLCRSDCECPGEQICCEANTCGTVCSNTTESGAE